MHALSLYCPRKRRISYDNHFPATSPAAPSSLQLALHGMAWAWTGTTWYLRTFDVDLMDCMWCNQQTQPSPQPYLSTFLILHPQLPFPRLACPCTTGLDYDCMMKQTTIDLSHHILFRLKIIRREVFV